MIQNIPPQAPIAPPAVNFGKGKEKAIKGIINKIETDGLLDKMYEEEAKSLGQHSGSFSTTKELQADKYTRSVEKYLDPRASKGLKEHLAGIIKGFFKLLRGKA